jgi:hypothetical protein
MVKVKLTVLRVIINPELHEVTRPTRGNEIINKLNVIAVTKLDTF